MAYNEYLGLTEHQIQNMLIEYLTMKGHFVWRNNTGVAKFEYTYKTGIRKGMSGKRFLRAGKKGSADIIGISKDGKFIAVEVKRKGGKTTPAQDEFLERIREKGGYAIVAYDENDVINAGL